MTAGLADEAAALVADTRVDILVNNAGIIRRAPATDMPVQDWDTVLAINLDAVFLLTRAAGTQMVARGSGKIITIASLLSFQGGVNVVGYTASKHAVVGMTRALANEWAPAGVQVNAIAPGYIATNNTTALRADPDREPQIRAAHPGRPVGHPRRPGGRRGVPGRTGVRLRVRPGAGRRRRLAVALTSGPGQHFVCPGDPFVVEGRSHFCDGLSRRRWRSSSIRTWWLPSGRTDVGWVLANTGCPRSGWRRAGAGIRSVVRPEPLVGRWLGWVGDRGSTRQ